MNKMTIRTIKPTDRISSPTPMEIDILQSTHNARTAKSNIETMLKNTEQQLAKAISATYPDARRIARLQETVNNLRQTIARAQHQH